MDTQSRIELSGQLSATLYHADGRVRDLGVLSGAATPNPGGIFLQPVSFWRSLWRFLRHQGRIPLALTFGAFLVAMLQAHLAGHGDLQVLESLVTVSGANYLAADFLATSANHISAFNYHDCGTGGAYGSTVSVNTASNATPIVITTATPHGRTTNDLVSISGVLGNTAANGIWQIAVLTSTTFSLIGSVGNGAYTSGGSVQLVNGAADTALVTPAGITRVVGAQTNPSSGVYNSAATILFSGTSKIITEWALFSAPTSGTLFDRRWFNDQRAPGSTPTGALNQLGIGVSDSDSINFQYNLTVSYGGN